MKIAKSNRSLGDLKPNQYKDVCFSFYTNRRIPNKNKIPITLDLSEKRADVKASVDIDLVMNAPHQPPRLLSQIIPKETEDYEEVPPSVSVDVDRNIPEGETKRPHAIAVIIGNKNYARFGHGIPDVDYAARDAAYMKKYVINLLGYDEENVICKFDATQGHMSRIFGTKGNFESELYNWVRAEAGKADVFIYYVGHGAPDPKGKGAFLMPVDASADYISANGYPLDTFYNNLEKIPAKSITIVLDTCFSGNSAAGMLVKNISPATLKSASHVRKLNNGVIFSSAGKDQVSHWYPEKQHSLFTYFFMKGLGGKADENGNKTITVAEMKEYLRDKVPYRARRLTGREQTPVVVGDESCEMARLK
jgi:hypothetical protein